MMSDAARKNALVRAQARLLARKNRPVPPGNGIFTRYRYPVLTADHAPLAWRVEGWDRKSFFAVARSRSPVDGFRFDPEPILLPETSMQDVTSTICASPRTRTAGSTGFSQASEKIPRRRGETRQAPSPPRASAGPRT